MAPAATPVFPLHLFVTGISTQCRQQIFFFARKAGYCSRHLPLQFFQKASCSFHNLFAWKTAVKYVIMIEIGHGLNLLSYQTTGDNMENVSQSEKRLQILEEKFEYQDNTVEALNQVIIEMQKEIDQLKEDYQDLKKEVAAMEQAEPIANDPPPHY